MTEDERRAAELWRLAERAVRAAFAQPTEACPGARELLRYALACARERDLTALPKEVRAIGRHKAFCGHCARRFRLLQAALASGARAQLLLSTMIKAVADLSGQRLLQELGEWISQRIDAALRPQAIPVTLGPVRTRGGVVTRGAKRPPEVRAQLVDPDGQPTGEFVVLHVEQGPEIEHGRFTLSLKAPEPRYEGYEVRVALELDEGIGVELGTASIQQGAVSITTEVRGLGLEFEPVIPLHLLAVTLQPKK